MIRSVVHINRKFLRGKSFYLNNFTVIQQNNSQKLIRFSSTFSDIEDDSDSWPKSKLNMGINVCPEGQQMIVERLGKFHSVEEAGRFFSIPLIDHIKYVVDMREKTLLIRDQVATSKDNIRISISTSLQCRFVDSQKAVYNSINPINAMKQHAKAAIQAVIAELTLDEILSAHGKLNDMIKLTIRETAMNWGIELKTCDIIGIQPDKAIMETIEKHIKEGRERINLLLEAENQQKLMILQSETDKLKYKNETDSITLKIQLEAEAVKKAIILKVCN